MAGPQRRPPGPHLPYGSISVITLNVDRQKVAGPVPPATPPSADTRRKTSPYVDRRPGGRNGPVAKPTEATLGAGRHQFPPKTLLRGE